jgi:squalene-hopene/tetraprenyl-beta-curcumene cyclase
VNGKRSKTAVLAGCLALAWLCAESVAGAAGRDPSLLLESRAAVLRALRYLEGAQRDDGSWQSDPAITGLVVTAMMGSGLEEFGPQSGPVGRGLNYIRSFARPDGGIYDRFYASYGTSVCAMALVEAGQPQDRPVIARARRFLLGAQADESEDLDPQDTQYGGWGYEPHQSGEGMHRADMSNTQFAIEAIRSLEEMAEEDTAAAGTGDAGRTRTELCYERAIGFLERCQNLRTFNDQPWASNDGGFVYRPGESKAGETPDGGLRSYAGMTYAGLKSMIYARLSRDDPRVQAAYDWVRRHWSVTENPGLGQQGLYYYYLTMARALNAYGEESIVDAEGVEHDWRAELVGRLLEVQRADGSWVNENGRWMEQIPELVTAYSVLALEHATSGW